MDISGTHVAVLVHNYFEQAEFEEPIGALKDAGAEVTVISADKKALRGMQHAEMADKFTADLLLEQANPGDYDGLVLPGGAINADNLRVVEAAKEWVLEFLDAGRPLAVICHAPWILVSADAVEGRRLTSYHTIRDDIINAGGEWIDLAVVIDDNLITSRQPDDLPEFDDALIAMLAQRPELVTQSAADTRLAADEFGNEEDARLRALGYDRQRDEIDDADEEDILADQAMDDPDALQPSDLGRGGRSDEQSDIY